MKTIFRKFLDGNCYNCYEFLGSNFIYDENNNILKTIFRTYSPNAKKVYLITYYPYYNKYEMVREEYGFFTITLDYNMIGTIYKYEIINYSGEVLLKSDPFAKRFEVRPNNASIVVDTYYEFGDDKYFKNKDKNYDKPLLIYEMNLGSWKRKNNNDFFGYKEIVNDIIYYVKNNNYTHVEFMPIYEYPLDDSWGYQGTGFFAPTSRFGSFQDFCYLVHELHKAGIGVILDFVLGHINKDSFGLYRYDGSFLYEFEDGFRRENITWGTANLDFGKGQTRSFMQSAINFWINYMHIDGFRIDAVSNLIYVLGNPNNGENKRNIEFISSLNKYIDNSEIKTMMIAEDSSTYNGVTNKEYGLGFDYKWNMGFMNDTIKYYNYSDIDRHYNHKLITFSFYYLFNERFLNSFSHDEVVHGKGSMINKMFGTYDDKFLNYRNFLIYLFTVPGKKLLFQGQEFAQFSEWDFNKALDWSLYNFPKHENLNKYFKALSYIYSTNKELFENEYDSKSFKWIRCDVEKAIFSYLRYDKNLRSFCMVVLNMLNREYEEYEIGVPNSGLYYELINSYELSENKIYKSRKNELDGYKNSINLHIRPYQAVIIKLK